MVTMMIMYVPPAESSISICTPSPMVAERFDTLKLWRCTSRCWSYSRQMYALIPHFTLGITYPTHEHLLLLVIRKAMYASYSTLYSRHASCTQRVLLLVLLKANVCLLFQTLLSAFYTSSMHGHLLLVIFKTMYICLLFKALLHALRTLLVLLLAILKAVYVSYSWLYTLALSTQRIDTSCRW